MLAILVSLGFFTLAAVTKKKELTYQSYLRLKFLFFSLSAEGNEAGDGIGSKFFFKLLNAPLPKLLAVVIKSNYSTETAYFANVCYLK